MGISGARILISMIARQKTNACSSVDLEKPENMRIWLQNFVSIQPRTSPRKSAMLTVLVPQVLHAAHGSENITSHDTSLFPSFVLGCIDTDFRIQIRILQHFSKSTKLSSWFFEKVAKFCKKSQKIAKILRNFRIFAKKVLIFAKIADFLQIFANFLKI